MRSILALLLLAVGASAEMSLTLDWDVPAAPVGSFRLYEKTATGWVQVVSIPGDQTRYTLANYDAKAARTFALTAVNSVNATTVIESDRSNELSIPQAPQTPSGLKVEVVVNITLN